MPFTVQFKSSNSAAKMLSADIIGCTPGKTLPTLKKVTTEVSKGSDTAENVVIPVDTSTHESQSVESEITNSPAIARSLVFGKVFPGGRSSPASMQLVLELEPFDGKEFSEGGPGKLVIPYTCNFNILSKVGNNILLNKEIQPVNVEVTFGFSELGAVNQNLEEMIAYEKEAVDTGFWGAIGTLNTVLTWIGRALNVYNMIQTAKTLYKAYSMGVDTFGTFPGGDASVASFCFGVSTFEGAIEDVLLKELETPIQILSCKITPANFFYGKWVETVLSIYNLEIGKSASDNEGLTGKESATRAKSVKDNLFLSLATVCVPGLIQGLDRLRQIKCRKISCLENEVANNVATVQMCNQLENRQICKYVVGDLWYAIPFTQLWDKIVGIFSDAFNNILSFARVAIIAGCGLFCWVPKTGNSLHVGCLYAYYGLDILKFIDSMVSFGYEIKSIVENEGGLNYCDSVLEEKKPDSPKETPSLSADAPKKDG